MTIKILGSGCPNCRTLEHRTREALDQLGLTADIDKVQDHRRIAAYGIMRTPGLVIDERVVSAGVVLPVDKIKELLVAHQTKP